ncbi:hypothetical protein [Tardiphaga sp.]|jgi:hypothetical protein|uniref:hypothetical protein n=1 Tax=Tardiphaga sp. TaxID=1926292 RepID=UPI0037D9DE64
MDSETLEQAARILEAHPTNDMYRKAFRAGAKLLRSMKKLPDNPDQITSSEGSSGAPSGRLVSSGTENPDQKF